MIAAGADLLVIGGLTVDRFADGSSASGGSVLHIARALAPRGTVVAVITVAGPEPEAQAGLEELRQLAVTIHASAAPATATFAHRESIAGRRLVLDRRGGPLRLAGEVVLGRAVLLAPIAGEIAADELSQLGPVPIRAAILQGWLRSLEEGTEVQPLPLRALPLPLVDGIAGFDLLVASREDLVAEADDPRGQLIALRRTFGARPDLVVTDGAEGAWLDSATQGTRHLPVPRVAANRSTVGAGDVLAALLAVGIEGATESADARLRAAMRTVAKVLEERGA